MNINGLLSVISEIASKPLFSIAGTTVTLFSIALFFLLLLITITVSLLLQRGLRRALKNKFSKRAGTLEALMRLLHYFILIVGFSVALQFVGINLSALFAAGAVFAIAIGFAMQNVVQNFVAGVILLLERSIKPGDVLEVEGKIVKVVDMRIRTTIARTLVDEELILPNTVFSQSTVKNYTLKDNFYRLGVVVGVSYESDVDHVMRVMEETARKVSWRLPEPEPTVRFQEFGPSSIDFGVYVSIDDPWQQRVYMSDLRRKVWYALKAAGITIAYPQIDVHFDSSTIDSIVESLKQRVK